MIEDNAENLELLLKDKCFQWVWKQRMRLLVTKYFDPNNQTICADIGHIPILHQWIEIEYFCDVCDKKIEDKQICNFCD